MNETVELDLREIAKVLLKRVWIIILSAVILGTATLIYTANFVTPLYQAEATMYVNSNASSEMGISSSDYSVVLRQVESYTYAFSSISVLDKVAQTTGLDITGQQIQKMMKVTPVGETEMFKLAILSPDPQLSADIANVVADVAPGEISKIIKGSTAAVVDYARIPTSRYSPSYLTNTALGLIVGAVLAMAAIILHMYLDVRVKREEDLTRIFSAPVLGTIPELNFESTKTRRQKGDR